MSVLASKLQVSNQQLTKIVDNLVELQLVTRTTDPDNRRQLNVAITEKGGKSLRSLRSEIIKKLTLLSKRVDTVEIDKMYDSMMYLNTYFEKLSRALED
jgi:DNA-binding MarR family transcriptional regulator